MKTTRLPSGVYLAFCPTGEGGGVDNSCSPANAGIFSPELKREMGLPEMRALETTAMIARQAGVNATEIGRVETLYAAARAAYNTLRRQLRDNPDSTVLRARFNEAAREDRRLRSQLNNLRDAAAVIAPIDVPSPPREANELARLRDQYAQARQSYNVLRRRLRETPDDAELRRQFNMAVREDTLARRQLRDFEARQPIRATPAEPIRATPAERRETRQERSVARAEARVAETGRALSRVQQRIDEQARDIPFEEFTDREETQFLSTHVLHHLNSGNGLTELTDREMAMYARNTHSINASVLDRARALLRDKWNVRRGGGHLSGTFVFKTPSDRHFTVTISGTQSRCELIFSDDNRSTSRTGRGEAFHVFSSVVPAVTAFLDKYKPEKLYFSAAQESRFDLYDKLTQTVMAMRPNTYKVTRNRERGLNNPFLVSMPDGSTRRSRGGGSILVTRDETR